ncbi:MAG: chromosomal replication initiator DnaA [Boseongicola sp.]|nr:MAG: chromosomal replication initiator DnaA [Boseongicola sp.]
MPQQLTFELPVRPALGRGDFFVSTANALAVARLDTTQTWPNGKLTLIGPAGAGKTHLAHVWAEAENAKLISPADLTTVNVAEITTPIALDDADQIPSSAEEPLFHLHNHHAAQRLPFLLTASEAPARWPITLPDLKSRMSATDVTKIDLPDDALLNAVIVKLFADRQLAVSPNLIPWLITRTERSFAAIRTLVAELDAAALAEKRAITRPLAQATLDKMHRNAR